MDGVELAVRSDEPGPSSQRQGGKQPDHQLVRVGAEREAAASVSQQAREARADPLGLCERMLPLVIHIPRRVEPSRRMGIEAYVRPGLMGVAGEQEPLRHGEAGVMARERIGRTVEGVRIHQIEASGGCRFYSSVRMAHRSGNSGWLRVASR